MLVSTPGIIGGSPSYPPAGTWLSSVCSGPDAHDQGGADYYDVNGNHFYGMFNLWQQYADGVGGSYWTNQGWNTSDQGSACWLPAYFYTASSTDPMAFNYSGCGGSGSFEYGSTNYYTYANGDGTFTSGSSGGPYGIPSGYSIYDNGSGCCYVYYDGNGGYYVSDTCGGGGGCDSYGTYLGDGCYNTSGYDAAGNWWSGAWIYTTFYADGNCGTYTGTQYTNTSGCYYPAGYYTEWSSSNNDSTWTVYDSCGQSVASSNYTFGGSYGGTVSDGAGGNYAVGGTWNASYGDLFASGTFWDNCAGTDVNYEVRSDGGSGYYVNTY